VIDVTGGADDGVGGWGSHLEVVRERAT
jgi:hypothetical protein